MCPDSTSATDPLNGSANTAPAVYEPIARGGQPAGPPGPVLPDTDASALNASLLAENAVWFCYLRWVVIAALTVFGLLGIVPQLFDSMGLQSPGLWPFVTAALLTLANVGYLTATRVGPKHIKSHVMSVLWLQIALDLIVLTCVTYFVGSLRTYIPFAYLFHIALACIFFPHRQSLAVTLTACVLYSASVIAVTSGLLPPAHLFVEPATGPASELSSALRGFNFLMAIGIWLVVWYLVSHLATMVRQRDTELAAANTRLETAMAERRRHMLTTTHQLKSPFAAIQANTQLLLDGYCGNLPPEAVAVLQRIATRSKALATEIQDMLQLANLTSTTQQPLKRVTVDLAEILAWGIGVLEPTAQSRSITVKCDLKPAVFVGAEDHVKMLLMNLLSNAVNYSFDGGTVDVTCHRRHDNAPTVTVQDYGIGIPQEKLPRIFEEHYRTNEAVKHNKQSTGLGLAIVKRIAERYGIHIRVASSPGNGTTFELIFPQTNPPTGRNNASETQHGLPPAS